MNHNRNQTECDEGDDVGDDEHDDGGDDYVLTMMRMTRG